MPANRFDKSVFKSADYFAVVWLPVFNCFHHCIEAEDVFCSHKVVAKHDEVHFSIYFFRLFVAAAYFLELAAASYLLRDP